MSAIRDRKTAIDSAQLRTDLDANHKNIRNLDAPVEAGDAANRAYVDGKTAAKQDALVSGTNIKTVNGKSLLGAGNIVIEGTTGGVNSVNSKTGTVVLDATDIKVPYYEVTDVSVNEAFEEFDSRVLLVEGHAENYSNPHSVTAAQVGAAEEVHTHAQSDINGLADALGGKLDTTGGSLSGSVTITGSDLGETMEIDGAQFKLNNGSGFNFTEDDNAKQSPLYPDNTPVVTQGTGDVRYLGINANAAGLTQSGVTALFANAVSSTTSTTLKDRDCATVAFSSGMTLTFTASTGLRQFEILITDCTASGSINFPDVTYRGASDALTLEAGDNHLVFAEYAANCFFVTRAVANTITIS